MAVAFSKIPNNYSSVFGDLIYTLSGIASGSVADVDIVRYGETVPIGVKRFSGGRDIDVNIASHLRRWFSPQPMTDGRTRIGQDSGRNIKVLVRCGGVASVSKLYTCAAQELSNYEILTILPDRRTIWWDESDEISFLAPINAVISFKVILTGANATYKYEANSLNVPEGITSFLLSMSEIAAKAVAAGYDKSVFDLVRVELYRGGVNIANVDYDIRKRAEKSIRLCWLNSMGGMDYHTFRCCAKEEVTVTKNSVINKGRLHSYSTKNDTITEVTSGYMPYSWVCGLVEVLSSPLVWRADGVDYFPVDVLPTNVEKSSGKLNMLSFEIRDTVKPNIQKI